MYDSFPFPVAGADIGSGTTGVRVFILICGSAGTKLIVSGAVGVVNVGAVIDIFSFNTFLGLILAFTSNGIIGSLTLLKLAIPNPFDEPEAKFDFLFLLSNLYWLLSGEIDLS